MTEPDTLTTIVQALQSLGVLLIVFSGLLLIVQAPRVAGRFIFLGFVLIVISQIGPHVVAQISLPVLLVASILIVLAVFGQFLAIFIGSRAADVAIGNIVATLVTAVANLLASLVTAVAVLMLLPLKKLREFLGRPDEP